MIRDADKLDNCRVKLVDSVEAMIGVPRGACRRGQNISKGMGILPEKRGSFISRPDYVRRLLGVLCAQYYDLEFLRKHGRS